MADELLTIDQVAQRLHISKTTLRRHGIRESYRIGRRPLYDIDDVKQQLRQDTPTQPKNRRTR
mgnify:CR=1 FL=1